MEKRENGSALVEQQSTYIAVNTENLFANEEETRRNRNVLPQKNTVNNMNRTIDQPEGFNENWDENKTLV